MSNFIAGHPFHVSQGASEIRGVWPAIVVDNKDSGDNLGYRGKIKLPWLSEQDTALWARTAIPMAGADRGTYVLLEIDDQMLAVFEHGNVDRPIVIRAILLDVIAVEHQVDRARSSRAGQLRGVGVWRRHARRLRQCLRAVSAARATRASACRVLVPATMKLVAAVLSLVALAANARVAHADDPYQPSETLPEIFHPWLVVSLAGGLAQSEGDAGADPLGDNLHGLLGLAVGRILPDILAAGGPFSLYVEAKQYVPGPRAVIGANLQDDRCGDAEIYGCCRDEAHLCFNLGLARQHTVYSATPPPVARAPEPGNRCISSQ